MSLASEPHGFLPSRGVGASCAAHRAWVGILGVHWILGQSFELKRLRKHAGEKLSRRKESPNGVLPSGVILYLAADLLWASKIKGTADAVGVLARPVRTVEMLEARLADSDVRAVVLDLDKPEEAMAMLGRLRGPAAGPRERSLRVVVFGPHVAKDLFQAARDAGADEVLTRGAFDHAMDEVLVRLEAASPKGG